MIRKSIVLLLALSAVVLLIPTKAEAGGVRGRIIIDTGYGGYGGYCAPRYHHRPAPVYYAPRRVYAPRVRYYRPYRAYVHRYVHSPRYDHRRYRRGVVCR